LQQAAAVEAATHFAPVARPRLSTTVDRLNFGSLKTPEKRWSISTLDLACGPNAVRQLHWACSHLHAAAKRAFGNRANRGLLCTAANRGSACAAAAGASAGGGAAPPSPRRCFFIRRPRSSREARRTLPTTRKAETKARQRREARFYGKRAAVHSTARRPHGLTPSPAKHGFERRNGAEADREREPGSSRLIAQTAACTVCRYLP
jgi:hypothetical protein